MISYLPSSPELLFSKPSSALANKPTRLEYRAILGGPLGRKIEPMVVDGCSDWPTFAREAERLITEEKVSVIFSCWTSACRKTVKLVVEKYNHLLFYPVQYEGLEQSPNIVYTGAAANQQLIPAVKWCFDHLGRKFFLIGSDYVFPRTANAIIKDHIAALKGKVLGEEYILLGSGEVKGVVRNGDTNDGQFAIVWTSDKPVRPVPYPIFRLRSEWQTFLQDLYRGWGGKWSIQGRK